MKACSTAKHYRGLKPPRCRGGNPCEACKAIWEATGHGARRQPKAPRPDVSRRHNQTVHGLVAFIKTPELEHTTLLDLIEEREI